ncbi:hypothetical protein [Falsiroseomonas sp. E2-1-a20]|uniref:hypothetical protein n=1 Tax=Falsiroseomonas sp. E2-1-a20 TaxID=3239300 RepID=UPI003F2C9D2A
MFSTLSAGFVRRPVAALSVGCLLFLSPLQADAQVRRSQAAASRPSEVTRPPASVSQRPATRNTVNSSNVTGNTRIGGAGSNVAIGNEINVVRPAPAGGYPAARPPAYRPPAAGYPPGYRPPIAVPVYPGHSAYSGPSTGQVVAAGVIAGATAGLISGAMQQPSSTTVVTVAPAAPIGTSLQVGMQLSALPSGCSVQPIGGVTYHRCGNAWVQGYMQGSQVIYAVVPAPPG